MYAYAPKVYRQLREHENYSIYGWRTLLRKIKKGTRLNLRLTNHGTNRCAATRSHLSSCKFHYSFHGNYFSAGLAASTQKSPHSCPNFCPCFGCHLKQLIIVQGAECRSHVHTDSLYILEMRDTSC